MGRCVRHASGEPLLGHSDCIFSVAFSPDNTRVSGSADRTVQIWDAVSGMLIDEPPRGHSVWVLSVAFSPDGALIVPGSVHSTVRIWDAVHGVPVGEPLREHSSWVTSVAYCPDSSQDLLTGSSNMGCCVGRTNWQDSAGAFSPCRFRCDLSRQYRIASAS
jgi:WD40 repeat protein